MTRYDAARPLAGIVAGLALLLAGCGEETGEPGATVTVTEEVTVTPSDSASPTESPSATPSDDPAEEPSGDAEVPRTYDAALEHFDTWGSEPVEAGRFETPSGNIYCVVDSDLFPSGCEIRDGAVRDPAVCGSAPTDIVGRIEFQRRRAVPVCNTDTFFEPDAPTLGYGEAARVPGGDVMCLSETIGVTCISTSRTEGFFLHKGEYVIFNAG